MIFGYFNDWEKELNVYSPVLQKGFKFLTENNLECISLGRHGIDGEKMFALVSEYMVEPKQNKRPEAHQKYIDIQYIVHGEEKISVCRLLPDFKIAEDKLAEKDIIFFESVQDEADILVSRGSYAIFFPNDVHRPGCINEKSIQVKKVIIKIAIDSLR